MKWGIAILFLLIACRKPGHKKEPVNEFPLIVHDSNYVPHDSIGPGGAKVVSSFWHSDTGYFRIEGPAVIRNLDETGNDTCQLLRFLQANLSTKDIRLLNTTGLLHTIHITADTVWRMDTLTGDHTVIIQKVNQDSMKLVSLKIDGHKNEWPSVDLMEMYDDSFREFDFKGHRFYYLSAMIMGSHGGSASLIRYNILYDRDRKTIDLFDDFRTHGHLYFGDVDGDDRLDYLDLQNDGGYGLDTINHFRITLWSHNPATGYFVQRKDARGKEYFIEGNSGTDYYVGEAFKVDKLYWPVPMR